MDAGIKTAKIKQQYTIRWGKNIGRYAHSKTNVILFCLFKGGSLNGWYDFF